MSSIKTYISLFSSAGVGCFGFKQTGFECVATNELIERRLNVQKCNKKCKYESGYICGDITRKEIQDRLYNEIDFWKKNENLKEVDVVIATPPCQGMSVANHKKSANEIVRNSLVIESIKIIKKIHPKFFVFENVPAFMKTLCTDVDGIDKPISKAIEANLGSDYIYYSKVINFKNYGACSSRMRTLVIGVRKSLSEYVSPFELFPDFKEEKSLKEVIGNLKSLTQMGEISDDDIYHAFRSYPVEMRSWIHDLKEGESAFDNEDETKRPHHFEDGKLVLNKQKNADKYTRQCWDKVGPCVHTRNDQLASQNTIHPSDDRVFSIRELMFMMSVPKNFKWSDDDLEELNRMSLSEKIKYLKKEEIKIRQSLGEAVPTGIFRAIAEKITVFGLFDFDKEKRIIKQLSFSDSGDLKKFLIENPLDLSPYSLMSVSEMSNSNRNSNSAFYTNKTLMTEMLLNLNIDVKDGFKVLEPSVGIGNFVFLFSKKYADVDLFIDAIDIDEDSLDIFSIFINKYGLPKKCHLNMIHDDFLLHPFQKKYDLIIGNPPFEKISTSNSNSKIYKSNAKNKESNNIASYFLDKSLDISSYVSFVFPKFLLNTPEFKTTRERLSLSKIDTIIDFGEEGFKGVLIETIAINIDLSKSPGKTVVSSFPINNKRVVEQKYITDSRFPYWIIYRDPFFDSIAKKLKFDCFTVFRDRQITNSLLKKSGDIRVIKSRNIKDDGSIGSIIDYDSYLDKETASKLSVYKYLDDDNVYLTPNMTYYPRVVKKKKGCLVNGSVAILIPKEKRELSEKQLHYFSSDEFRKFYKIARNYQTRSLNVDTCSVFFFGVLKEQSNELD